MRMTRVSLLCSLLAAAASGCGSDVDDRPVSWSYIHAAIVIPNCATAGCHSELTKTIGFNFSDKADAWTTFMPDAGYDILGRLRGQVRLGLRMPPDQPLPNADIDLIAAWLAIGGPYN
jgi:hypothetical protein